MHVAQWVTAPRHFALQEVLRIYRRQHALAAIDLLLKDDRDPDIAGQATAGPLERTQEDQNAAANSGYKWRRKQWYASVAMW